jgi:hypothetical protein
LTARSSKPAGRRRALELVSPRSLKPYGRNARTHSPEQIEKVARSITEFGFINPILADDDGEVIAGHARLTAALQLELPTVPVVRITHLSKAQQRAYLLADNRLALDAGWDEPTWRADAGVNHNREKMGLVANDQRVDWTDAWALFPGDVIYCWHADRFASAVQESIERAGFEIRSQIIWAKDRFALSRGNYHWQHEPCWYAVRRGANAAWCGARDQSTLWRIAAREDAGLGHGTQKPIECMRRPIVNNSKRGGLVYEPFSGSGTTLIAAEMTGRRCLAMEIMPAYIDVAVRRWQSMTGKAALLEATGNTFDLEIEKRSSRVG